MSLASDFRTSVQATTIYEVMGQSRASPVIFWFGDGSVCAARKLPSDNKAVTNSILAKPRNT